MVRAVDLPRQVTHHCAFAGLPEPIDPAYKEYQRFPYFFLMHGDSIRQPINNARGKPSGLSMRFIDAAVVVFFQTQISPLTLMTFEMALLGLVREMGRQLLEGVLNASEPGLPDELPKDLSFECGGYRRRNQKTANRHVASRFGDIVLHRYVAKKRATSRKCFAACHIFLEHNPYLEKSD